MAAESDKQGSPSYLQPVAKVEMKMLSLRSKATELLPHVDFPEFMPKYTRTFRSSTAGFRYKYLRVNVVYILVCMRKISFIICYKSFM